jgi:hypothetical protein
MGNVKKLMHIVGAFDKNSFQTCECNCTQWSMVLNVAS